MKGHRIVVGARRSRYVPVVARDPLATPRVAGGGIFESDPIERLDAASRREERHKSFEENRETFEDFVEKHGAWKRMARKIRVRLGRKL